MAGRLKRQDFLIDDLVISVAGGSRGGTWMPGPDDETPPTPISPVAGVLSKIHVLEAVREVVVRAVEAKEFEAIGLAFAHGDAGGDPVLRQAIYDIGAAVVASAAYAALGGGSVGLPDPNCGGTSLETIPTPLTPVVHVGLEIHRVVELPRLRKQLAETVAFVDKAAVAQAPRSAAEIKAVRAHLEEAANRLG